MRMFKRRGNSEALLSHSSALRFDTYLDFGPLVPEVNNNEANQSLESTGSVLLGNGGSSCSIV